MIKGKQMYYKIKSIKVLKDGTIKLTAAASNVCPITYEKSDFKGTMGELLCLVRSGDFHLNNTKSNEKYIKMMYAINHIVETNLDANGLDFDSCMVYGITERDEAIKLICDSYADRLLRDDYSDPIGFGRKLGEKVAEILFKGLEAMKKRIAADKEQGIVRVTCAAYSIFEDKDGVVYDLLQPYESGDEFVLAPKDDYDNRGVLQTDPSKIIRLGKGSGNYYAFLSGSGISLSREDYVKSIPKAQDEIEKMFDNVDRYVAVALNAGLKLIDGKTPYAGYTTV